MMDGAAVSEFMEGFHREGKMRMRTWLITGCSSGLGRAFALAALENGDRVVATARQAEAVDGIARAFPDRALALALDIRDGAQGRAVVESAVARFGGVDILVNNAGYSYRAAVEEGEDEEVRSLFETNFFGAVSMIKAVLPSMRQRQTGTIVNISSDAGRGASPGSGYYAATKFALEGMSEALRKEVAPLGIRVLVVEPGAFRTSIKGASMRQSKAPMADYADTAGRRREENLRGHGTQRGDPARAAQALITALAAKAMPSRLVIGPDAFAFIANEVALQAAELEAWKDLSLSTDFATGKQKPAR